ncbi:MAG TPA: hypothetical protein VIL45_08605 [Thermoplasmata archaeon]
MTVARRTIRPRGSTARRAFGSADSSSSRTKGDGVLDASDTVVRSDLVRFGRTERTEADGAWFFSAQSEDGRLRVTTRVPMAPDASTPLVAWTVAAQHACGAGATHYAVLIDESDPAQDERFVPAECGADVWPRARRDLARSPFSPSG